MDQTLPLTPAATCFPRFARGNPVAFGGGRAERSLGWLLAMLVGCGTFCRAEAATISVTTTNDSLSGGLLGSLRTALTTANLLPDRDTIVFDLPGPGPYTINLAGALPAIANPVTIDGTTQAGFVSTPIIELNGSSAGSTASGLIITGGDCTIRGLVINRFRRHGILIRSGGTNIVVGNFLGTGSDGASKTGNTYGNLVITNSSGNIIGGTNVADRNLISGSSSSDGVVVVGAGSVGNVIQGNFIGTDITGLISLGNDQDGVRIGLGACSNIVGGVVTGAGNLVSGNLDDGVEVSGATTMGNVIQGNFVGTDVTGLARLPNEDDGVLIDGAPRNLIGGATNLARNIISGNAASGVHIGGSNSVGNLVLGNFIGTDVTGTNPLSNVIHGVRFDAQAEGTGNEGDPSGNCVGGIGEGDGNVIAFNGADGVNIFTGQSIGVLGNSIIDNGKLPIDLSNIANGRLAAPVLVSALVSTSGTVVVHGTLAGRPDITYRLEFFSNPTCGAKNAGGGRRFLGTSTVDTDSAGDAIFDVELTLRDVTDTVISTTATTPDRSTSEFSDCVDIAKGASGAPIVIAQPISQTTTQGGTITLTVDANGSVPMYYQWRRNGVDLRGATNTSLTLTNFEPADSGAYSATVYNHRGSARSVEAAVSLTAGVLTMTDNFETTVGSADLTGFVQTNNVEASSEVGEPLHAGKRGGRSMWFTWQAPESGIVTFSTAGSDFDTLLAAYRGDTVNALVPVASDDDGAGFYNSEVRFNVESNAIYHIAVDGAGDASGTVILQWALEVTADVLPVITQQPESLIVGLGSNAVFTVVAAGGSLEYQWFFNNALVTNATNSSLSIGAAGLLDVGRYFVEVRRGSRTVTSQSAALQLTLTSGVEQDVFIADKFIDMVLSGRPLQLDPPPAASFPFGGVSPSGPSRGYSGSQVFSTVGSLKEPGEPNHCGVPGGASQWFAFQAGADGVLDMNTDGSTFDTVLAVYTGPGADFASLIPVVCDNDSGTNGLTSSLHFTTTSGTIYYVAIDGVNGASGTVVLNYTTLGEQQRPSITITSAPPVNVGLTNSSVILSGLATDNTELSAVEWRVTNSLGATEWTLASGSNSWTLTAGDLAFGNNTVQIRSLDTWGNVSAIASRVYMRLAPVTLTVEGCGSVSSGFLGTTYREPGKSISLAATPCAGFLFGGWSGDWVTNRSAVTLVVQTGLVLQANFLTNQFAKRIGNYAGLFYDTNTAAHESSGFVTARTTAKGTYSGRLRIGSKSHSFSGIFGLDGLATNAVRRGGTNLPLRLELNFNLNQLVQSVTGRVVDTNWTANLSAFRAVFHSRTNPAVYQGRYTVLFAANGTPGTPDGDGYGVVTVGPNGSVRLGGALADGASISQGTFVSREGLWPFYVPLRSGRGSVFSWLTFGTNEVAFGTNAVQSDLGGDARWFTPTLATARYYPDGFTNALDAVGSRFIPPVSSTNGSLTFSNGTLVFNGGNLSAPFTNEVLRASNDRVTDQGTNRLALSVTRSSGLFRGSVNVGETGRAISFKGVLFQNGDFGAGYFLQTNLGGSVWFGPRD